MFRLKIHGPARCYPSGLHDQGPGSQPLHRAPLGRVQGRGGEERGTASAAATFRSDQMTASWIISDKTHSFCFAVCMILHAPLTATLFCTLLALCRSRLELSVMRVNIVLCRVAGHGIISPTTSFRRLSPHPLLCFRLKPTRSRVSYMIKNPLLIYFATTVLQLSRVTDIEHKDRLVKVSTARASGYRTIYQRVAALSS